MVRDIKDNETAEMKNLQKQIAYLKDILKMKRVGGNSKITDVDLGQKYKRLQQ